MLAAESPVAVALNPETRSKSPDYDCEGMLIIWEMWDEGESNRYK